VVREVILVVVGLAVVVADVVFVELFDVVFELVFDALLVGELLTQLALLASAAAPKETHPAGFLAEL